MKLPIRPRRRLRSLLAHSMLAGAGLVAVPDPATAGPITGTDARDDTSDDDAIALEDRSDDIDDIDGTELAGELAHMNPFDATEAAANAALAPDARVRHALAEALASVFPLVGDDFVLDQLAHDRDIDVRTAALRACEVRGYAVGAHAPRVLVIDDYPGSRTALCACLSELGCDAVGAPSQVAVADVPWRELVDVVIANHEPPWSDGEKLVGELRQHAPDLPAIVLSDPATPVEMTDEITLVKPFGLDDLATAIHALARK